MVKKNILFKVDGKMLKTIQGNSILQACFKAYIDIPRFCYHEGLRIAGNCRMCLVEVANNRKLIASCATPLISSFSIFTKTFRVKKARQAILEFLLINHPLDCPICDQGGECDLQDITLIFGSDRGRFYEVSKRAVFDKNLGPLIKTSMNRCIHCTRCIRFFQETSFISEDKLGLLGRGSSTEVGTYTQNFMLSELSGNVIDLCPVGALTSKPYAFKARNWELYSQFTYDIIDVFMPRIRFDLVGRNILRVLPYMNIYQQGWINNRTRFCYDTLNLQRQDSCLWNVTPSVLASLEKIKGISNVCHDNVIYITITWKDAFSVFLYLFLDHLDDTFNSFISSLSNLEETWYIKQFFLSIGNSNIFFEDFGQNMIVPSLSFSNDFRNYFTLDWALELVEVGLWFVFLLGLNLRLEAPLLFLQIKKNFNKGFIQFISFNSTFLVKTDKSFQINISLRKLISFFEYRSNVSRTLLKSIYFYKYMVLVNFEFSVSSFFNIIKVLLEKFFYIVSLNYKGVDIFNERFLEYKGFEKSPQVWSTCIIQRYIGYISYSELSLQSFLNFNNSFRRIKALNLFFDSSIFCLKKNKTSSLPSLLGTHNILFNSSVLDLSSVKQMLSLIFPVQHAYEEEVSFFDVFLQLKRTTAILSVDSSRKSLRNIFNVFSVFLRTELKYTWINCFFIYFFINLTSKITDDLFFYIIGEGKKGFLNNFKKNILCSKIFETWAVYYMNTWFLRSSENLFKVKSFYFFNTKIINILPVLNFYNEERINLVNYSKTMQKSSLAYEKSSLHNQFSLFYI